VTAVEGDILDPGSLAAAVEGVSAIIHLAALLRSADSELIWKVNVEGSRNLIDAAKRHAPDVSFIMASTGLIYNPDAQRPSREGDAAEPKMPYPASKLTAENELRESGLNWSIQRLGFVYGDNDEHIAMVPRLAGMFGWHPANRLSMIHHQDIATAMKLALTGAFDRRTVNIVDEAPTTIYELAQLGGTGMEPSGEPMARPWFGHLDGGLARELGFQPLVRTVHQAAQEGAL
jgi:nucleoside-diphosphate-sugar epimerase